MWFSLGAEEVHNFAAWIRIRVSKKTCGGGGGGGGGGNFFIIPSLETVHVREFVNYKFVK